MSPLAVVPFCRKINEINVKTIFRDPCTKCVNKMNVLRQKFNLLLFSGFCFQNKFLTDLIILCKRFNILPH